MVGGMITPDFVIDALGGTKALADALSLDISTVSCWRESPKSDRKGGIPPARWLPIARLAADRGVSGITLEALAEMAARTPAEARA
jgi:hypothetical protein